MTRAGRAAFVAVAGALSAFLPYSSVAHAQAPRRASLTVEDHLGAGQQEETIAVYLAGVLAGTLHVDSGHPDDRFVADVPAMANLPFALCGKLLRREPAGGVSMHTIDNGGSLSAYEGGTWAAITIGDVLFTLTDETGQGRDTYAAGPACSAAVS